MNITQVALNAGVGVVAGLLASYMFFYFLTFKRPSVAVSPRISRTADERSGEQRIRIKVINRTRAPLVDIHAQLHVRYRAPGGYQRAIDVPLRRADPLVIPKYSRRSREHEYAYRFASLKYSEVLAAHEHIQGEEVTLRFRMVCRHLVTGTGTWVEGHYAPEDIVDGEFMLGNTFQIVSNT